MAKTECIKEMKMSDHCEEICVKALISKNNSACENAISQTLYGSWTLRVMGSWQYSFFGKPERVDCRALSFGDVSSQFHSPFHPQCWDLSFEERAFVRTDD